MRKTCGRSGLESSERSLYLMALPGTLVVTIFCYIPMAGIILAFKHYDFSKGVFGSEWVGFENFRFFFESGVALRLIRNTVGLNFLFMVTVQFCGVFVALLLNEIYEYRISKLNTVYLNFISLSCFSYISSPG